MNEKMYFSLNITPEHYRLYYQGVARFVHVTTEDGRTLRFPAQQLRRFVGHNGIRGRFEIEFDARRKLVSLKQTG